MVRTWLVASLLCSPGSVLPAPPGKSLSMLARLGRLDRSVHRQQIGLLRQIIDGRNNLPDGLRLLAESDHALRMLFICSRIRSIP